MLPCFVANNIPAYISIRISHFDAEVTVAVAVSGVPKGGFGVFNPPPQNSEDIGGVLDRISKKNRRLDFLL